MLNNLGESAESKLRAREAELARIQRIGQIGGLEVDLRHGEFKNVRSPEYLAVHGLPPDAIHESHEAWVARIHPDDRARVVGHFLATVKSPATEYEVEYRIIRPSDGQTRWILAKAEITRDEHGGAVRLVGAHIDITARRRAEEQRELIARELSHRIANIFTVVNSLVRMAARFEPASKGFAEKLQSRFQALHRAHAFVVDKEIGDGGLTLLLSRLLDPYREGHADRVTIQGEDAAVGPSAATALALIFHELATNAVKYGALSSESGSVSVSTEVRQEQLFITWQEIGGPDVVTPSGQPGFGSVLVDRAAQSQLGAKMQYLWLPTGLVAVIEADLADLRR
ncbi:PAS domain-containing protein [Bosea sp. 2YAB26]|uniref:PAS domain-containing protein n=2 Tax=Pseudomonadota TaxID=1224 RepID=UPI003F8F488A